MRLSRHRQIALAEEAAALAAAAAAADDDETKKLKRPRKPRRSQLEDAYPALIQEAFFGMKAIEGKALVDVAVEEPILAEHMRQTKREPMLKAHELSMDAAEMLRNDINENEMLENMDLGNIDTDIDIDNIDFSLFDDEYDEELEDSLQGGDMDSKDGIDKILGPTSQFTIKIHQKLAFFSSFQPRSAVHLCRWLLWCFFRIPRRITWADAERRSASSGNPCRQHSLKKWKSVHRCSGTLPIR